MVSLFQASENTGAADRHSQQSEQEQAEGEQTSVPSQQDPIPANSNSNSNNNADTFQDSVSTERRGHETNNMTRVKDDSPSQQDNNSFIPSPSSPSSTTTVHDQPPQQETFANNRSDDDCQGFLASKLARKQNPFQLQVQQLQSVTQDNHNVMAIKIARKQSGYEVQPTQQATLNNNRSADGGGNDQGFLQEKIARKQGRDHVQQAQDTLNNNSAGGDGQGILAAKIARKQGRDQVLQAQFNIPSLGNVTDLPNGNNNPGNGQCAEQPTATAGASTTNQNNINGLSNTNTSAAGQSGQPNTDNHYHDDGRENPVFNAYVVNEEQQAEYRQQRETELRGEAERRAYNELVQTLPHAERVDPEELRQQQQERADRAAAQRQRQLLMRKTAAVAALVVAASVACVVAVMVTRRDAAKSVPSREYHIAWILERVSGDAIYNKSSPRYQAFRWIVDDDPMQLSVGGEGVTSFTIAERYVIVLFFLVTGGLTNWTNTLGFLSNRTVCDWWDYTVNNGVWCHDSGSVRVLQVSENNLDGTIQEELSALEELEKVILYGNFLFGAIPDSLFKNTRLERISLHNNFLTGTIPDLSNLPDLRSLELHLNHLTGTLPGWVTSSRELEVLNIAVNRLSGTIPPFASQNGLEEVVLSDNLFEGPIPPSLGFLSALEQVYIRNNLLSGTIPTLIGQTRKLQELYANNNSLNGTIPTEIGNLQDLQYLGLYSNALTGPIPTELGGLSDLVELSLDSNHLTGTIPLQLAELERLRLLYLDNNSLTGDLSELCFIEEGRTEHGFAQQPFDFWTDCYGVLGQEIVCPCCTRCCSDVTGNCYPVKTQAEECHERVLQLEGSVGDDSGTVCECSEGGKVVSCKDSSCMYCNDADGTICYMDAGSGMELDIYDATYAVSIQYVRGRNEIVSLRWSDGQCLAAINGRDCASCRGVRSCPDGYQTFQVDCTNLGYGGAMGACALGNDPFVMLWDVANALYVNRNFPVRHDCIRVSDNVSREDQIADIVKKVSGDAIYDKSSPRHNAFRWLVDEDPVQLSVWGEGVKSYTIVERYVLVLFFLVTGGLSNWTNTLGFLGNTSVCDWWDPTVYQGILCHSYGSVRGIQVYENNLYGTIPDELSALEELEQVYLGENNLFGAIPESLFKNARLERISLFRNFLTGTIPDLSNLPHLRILEVQYNHLTGTLLGWVTSSRELERLSVAFNRLSGTIPPFASQDGLEFVSMGFNLFEGSIPQSLGSLSALEWLYLNNNLLVGTIPTLIGQATKLQNLYATSNSLSGTIPTEIGNLQDLQVLALSANALTGPIPTELGGLSDLLELSLHSNHLTGTIPLQLAELEGLQFLYLHNNSLTGDVLELCLIEEDRTEHGFAQQPFDFWTDCDGVLGQEIVCPCCTVCCNDVTDYCYPVKTRAEECQARALEWEGSAGDDSGTVCECSEGGQVVSCKDSSCMYCDGPDGSLCYVDAGTGMELSVLEGNRFFGASIQYVRGRDEHAAIRVRTIDGIDVQCLAVINGRECTSCRLGFCPGDGYSTFEVDCTNLGYGGAMSACSPGDDPFVMLWDIVNALFLNANFPVRHDCIRVSDNVSREDQIANIVKKVSGDAIYDKSSPRHDAFRWLVDEDPVQLSVGGEGVKSYTIVERYVLVLFFLVTGGLSNWTNTLGFLGNTSVCDWWDSTVYQGVLCHSYGSVRGILIDENNLYGTIPDELSALKDLEGLVLFDNNLFGTIPSSLQKNTMLKRISLYENSLSGKIPDLSNLRSIQMIELFRNHLTGTLPGWVTSSSELDIINVHDNLLSGTIPPFAPQDGLERVILSTNLFEGPIPQSLGSLSVLEALFLNGNQLSGPIPTSIGQATKLHHLYAYSNSLTATVPTELGNLRDLKLLALHDNILTGSIPTELGGLTGLAGVSLNGNHLTGNIPSELAGLEGLIYLYLQNNSLTDDVAELCFNQGIEHTNTGFDQLLGFYADCDGTLEPEVVCPCCTHCCNDVTGACSLVTTQEERCPELALQLEGSRGVEEDTKCECSEGGQTVSCRNPYCMYCNDADGTVCYVDGQSGMESGIGDDTYSLSVSIQYVRGRDEHVSLQRSNGQCLAAINGKDCASCRRVFCSDGYLTYEVDCSNLGYGSLLSACIEGDDPFVMLWDIANSLDLYRKLPVRNDCIPYNSSEVFGQA